MALVINPAAAFGIALSVVISFLQGLATAYIYAGRWAVVFFQAAMACAGLALVYGNPIRRAVTLHGKG